MRYQLVVPPEISRRIRSFGLSRDALLRMLNTLRPALEDHADDYRHRRDPVHSDLYFWIELAVWDHGQLRLFRFTVDDARATGMLFLVAAEEG